MARGYVLRRAGRAGGPGKAGQDRVPAPPALPAYPAPTSTDSRRRIELQVDRFRLALGDRERCGFAADAFKEFRIARLSRFQMIDGDDVVAPRRQAGNSVAAVLVGTAGASVARVGGPLL